MTVYNQGQLKRVLPYIPDDCEWFLLGGPADADETQTLHAKRPSIAIAGFEANSVLFNVQKARSFPGILMNVALWKEDCELQLVKPSDRDEEQTERCSSLVKYRERESVGDRVVARSLDSLSQEIGPFTKAFLWIDIEGAELECLIGAKELLSQGKILGANIEVFTSLENKISDYLASYDLKEVHRWNHHKESDREWWDIVYLKERTDE